MCTAGLIPEVRIAGSNLEMRTADRNPELGIARLICEKRTAALAAVQAQMTERPWFDWMSPKMESGRAGLLQC